MFPSKLSQQLEASYVRHAATETCFVEQASAWLQDTEFRLLGLGFSV